MENIHLGDELGRKLSSTTVQMSSLSTALNLDCAERRPAAAGDGSVRVDIGN